MSQQQNGGRKKCPETLLLNGNEYVSTERMSRISGYSIGHLRQLSQAGYLPAIRWKYCWFYNEPETMKALHEGPRKAQPHDTVLGF